MKKKIICTLTALSLMFGSTALLAGCSSKVDSSAKPDSSSQVKRDNDTPFSDVIESGLSTVNRQEVYTLDGHFKKNKVSGIASYGFSEWVTAGLDVQYEFAVEVLNMWMYYGDDASIRFTPIELIDGITKGLYEADTEDGTVGETVLSELIEFSSPSASHDYFEILGIEKPTETAPDDSSDIADPQTADDPQDSAADSLTGQQ